MHIYSIVNRWTRKPIVTVRTRSLGRALHLATTNRISLAAADVCEADLVACFLIKGDLRDAILARTNLSTSYLCHADLRGADLRGACLDHCSLRSADLRNANLRGASLVGADLCGAQLAGADLRNTNLAGSKLAGAACDWQWGVIAGELLRRDQQYLTLGVPLVLDLDCIEHSRPFEWIRLLLDHPTARDWATVTLRKAVKPEDNAPGLLRNIIANTVHGGNYVHVSCR
jgi:uncharacterized protein YjbI with pentapeptide repeats